MTPSKEPKAGAGPCPCRSNPFAALPPGMRPRRSKKKGGLRKATCPGCGKVYWTNRATDLCITCEKEGGLPS